MSNLKPARVREDREVRRAQIVDGAIRIIGEQGYKGFTIQELAARCGLSNAGLLYYFESKDHLLLSLLDEMERREEELLAPLVALATDSESAVNGHAATIGFLRGMSERQVAEPEQSRFLAILHAESLNPTHPAHRWFADREAETVEILMRLIEPCTTDPASSARQLIALLHGLTTYWLRWGDSFDLPAEFERGALALLPRP